MKTKTFSKILQKTAWFILLICFAFNLRTTAYADEVDEVATTESSDDESVSDLIDIGDFTISTSGESLSAALQIVLVLTVIALCPTILVMFTSFTRIVIVLHFTRGALNTNTAPPNQVIIGIALILTFFIMRPVFNEIYTDCYVPLSNGELSAEEALEAGMAPLRTFMFKQVNEEDLNIMCEIGGVTEVDDVEEDIPTTVLTAAFVLSELRIAFWIGFLIYIPFLIIDMVVASTLMSMGMMMLPPATISMPFKILLFVLADGWNLIIVNLIKTFNF